MAFNDLYNNKGYGQKLSERFCSYPSLFISLWIFAFAIHLSVAVGSDTVYLQTAALSPRIIRYTHTIFISEDIFCLIPSDKRDNISKTAQY